MRWKILLTLFIIICLNLSVQAKNEVRGKPDTLDKPVKDTLATALKGLWGYAFGDYFFKMARDPYNRGQTNQYTGLQAGDNRFQFRRIYLGYDYDINSKFSVEFLLASEDNGGEAANADTTASAAARDVLPNFKNSLFIKLLNLTVHDLWKGTDLVVGQQYTPAFPLLIEKIYGYREIEKTLTDRRGTPSFDLGVGLRGVFDPSHKHFGYDLLVANGRGSATTQTDLKWFYGDIWVKLLQEKLTLDVYGDLKTINKAEGGKPYRQRHMFNLFGAYDLGALTIGGEAFVNRISNGIQVSAPGLTTATAVVHSAGYSVFLNGSMIKNKLDYFLRYDRFNPQLNFDNALTYRSPAVTEYDPNTRESFFTCGLVYTPLKNIRFMPNIWLNTYQDQHSGSPAVNSASADVVYRLSFYFQFGHKKT